MTIDVYSIMRNEIQMLPYFLRHYERFADRILIWDDHSDDGTTELLRKHPKVILLPVDHNGMDDVFYVKYLWPRYKQYSRGKADWAICVDADEFVYHPYLLSVLYDCLSKKKIKITCEGWTMISDSFPTSEGQIYDEVKNGLRDKWFNKTVVFSPKMDMKWTNGRHYCANPGKSENTGIKMLHYRYLGVDYSKARDRKNLEGMGIIFPPGKKFNLPDGTKGDPYEWLEENKHRAEEVINGNETWPEGSGFVSER